MKALIVTLTLVAVLPFAVGCVNVRVGAEAENAVIVGTGLINGYLSFNAMPHYGGQILELGILSGTGRNWELAHLDVWPLGGVGVGLLGARARVLMIEAAVGVGLYRPEVPYYYRGRDEKKVIEINAQRPAASSPAVRNPV